MKNLFFLLFNFLLLSASAQDPKLMQLKFPVVPEGFYASVEFSNDGKLILFSEHQRTYLVDAVTYRTVYDFKNTSQSTFSPDGKYIVITYPGLVEVWDIATQKTIFSFPAEVEYSGPASLSTDGKYLVFMSRSANSSWPVSYDLVTLDFAGKRELRRIALDGSRPSLSGISKNNKLAVYDYSGKATIYDLQKGTSVYSIEVGSDTIRMLRFSPDEKWICVITSANQIHIYDAENGKLKQVYKGHQAAITDASFSNKGNMVVSSSFDKTVKIWNCLSGKEIKEFKEKDPLYNVHFSPKDNYIIGSKEHNWLHILNVSTGKIHNPGYLSFMAYYGGPKSISPDEQQYYSQSKILRLENAETLHEFKREIQRIDAAELSPDGRYLATIRGSQENLSIWDLAAGKLVADFGTPDTSRYAMFITDIKYSGDSKKLFAGWNNGDVWQWDLETGRVSKAVKAQKGLNKLVMNSKRDRLLALSDSVVMTFDGSLNLLYKFSADSFRLAYEYPVIYSPDESLLLLNGGSNKKAFILDSRSGKVVSTIQKHNWEGKPVISASNEKLLMIYENDPAFVYDIKTGSKLLDLKHSWSTDQNANAFVASWAELDDRDSLLFTFAKGRYPVPQTYFQVWNIQTGKIVRSNPFPAFKKVYLDGSAFLTLHGDSVTLRDKDNLQPLLSIDADNVIMDTIHKRLFVKKEFAVEMYSYELKKLMTIASFSKPNEGPFKHASSGGIIVLANNYYKADPDAITRIHFQSGLNVFGVNQFDVELNRPDLVLQALGSKDTTLLQAYKLAYEKRLKKLSLSDNSDQKVSAPVAVITNKNKIPSEQQSKNIQLVVEAFDSSFYLDRYNVWVNEVPLFGVRGAKISGKNKKFAGSISVPLSKGANRVEFAVINEHGKESYRQPIQVFQGTKRTIDQTHGYQAYDPKAPKEGKVYFIGIGIEKFPNATFNLQWSVKDIRDLAAGLSKTVTTDYELEVDTLFNENVTTSNILALKKKLLNTTVNDKVILSYSGHGLLSKDYDYYLSTFNVNFQRPEEGGLPYDALEALLDSIPARKKLMLIDACHSGEVDKEELQRIASVNQASQGEAVPGAKGSTPLLLNQKKVGMKNSFELMQELFVNVGKSTGATVISAAGGTQFALERGDLKNGVFTYSILEYMKAHSSATVSELKAHVNKRVPELTKGAQQPTTRTETKQVDWQIW